MLLPKDQVIRFNGADGERRAAQFEQELCGRGERIGNTVRMKYLTHLKPSFAAEVPQFSFADSARELGTNGRHEAMPA